jgi:hypothetical protein
VVLPASGWAMMANVRRRRISCCSVLTGKNRKGEVMDAHVACALAGGSSRRPRACPLDGQPRLYAIAALA